MMIQIPLVFVSVIKNVDRIDSTKKKTIVLSNHHSTAMFFLLFLFNIQYTGKEISESVLNDKWVIDQDKSNCTTPKSCAIDAKPHQFDLLETLSDGGNMFGYALAISER